MGKEYIENGNVDEEGNPAETPPVASENFEFNPDRLLEEGDAIKESLHEHPMEVALANGLTVEEAGKTVRWYEEERAKIVAGVNAVVLSLSLVMNPASSSTEPVGSSLEAVSVEQQPEVAPASFELESDKDVFMSEDSPVESGESAELESSFEKLKSEYLAHVSSDEYLQKLTLEFGDEEIAKQNQEARVKRLQGVRAEFLPKDEMKRRFGKDDPKGTSVGGIYFEEENKLFASSDISPTRFENLVTHELSHVSTKSDKLISGRAGELLTGSFVPHQVKNPSAIDGEKLNAYLNLKEERLARKQQLDMEMERLGIKKYGEPFTPEVLEKLNDKATLEKLSDDAKMFIRTTDQTQLKRIFDEIAQNDPQMMETERAEV